MVVGESIHNIMGGIENTGTVKQHNHKKKLRQRFDIIKKLGQGTFGKVQLGINKETGQEVAIKTIKKSKIESEADLVRIRREIQIMSSVQHPNIIHIYEVFENREKMVLVMEYAAGGELYDYLSERKVLDEEEARRIFRQIATACYYCHKHKICHRDLKLENILLDENNNAKIADFGLSNVFDDQRLLNTFCGSPLYASPEIVKGTPYHGPEVDCWSLGVLLYTLVYGAMPFDGSNFKRLVKQISQGDYFEPSKPSRASPLIREMLTVNPKHRAGIEKICTHWWVNEGYNDSCLDISEELANQTPVRLDVLLSLAPPPPQLESDKLLLTGEEESIKIDNIAPTRSQSVGSLMELTHPSERRIMNLINDEKTAPKRKLENTISTDRANLDKRKDKIIKENTVADITVHSAIKENASLDDASMSESLPLDRCSTQTISKEQMDVEPSEIVIDPSSQGAACTELIEEAEKKKTMKVKKTLSKSISNKILEGINEAPSQENVAVNVDKENIKEVSQETTVKKEEIVEIENKKPTKKKLTTKKVLTDKNENLKDETEQPLPEEKAHTHEQADNNDAKESEPEPPKSVERRKSRIFEAAEKFQNLITPAESKPMLTEKPKKVIIPGVSVDGFKKEFERKASLTQTPKPKPILTKKDSQDNKVEERVKDTQLSRESVLGKPEKTQIQTTPITNKTDEEMKERERVRNAVSIISSALDKEGTRKSKSRPCMMRKPPVPFGVSGRSASGNIGIISPLSVSSGPKPFIKPIFDKREESPAPQLEEENQTSSAEITLKSATLPRRKTSRAEITLKYPVPKPATMEFVTEMAHNVEAYQPPPSQRSEIVVPVSAGSTSGFRPNESKERIIPISFEKQETQTQEKVQSPPIKPPVPKSFQSQMSNASQTSNLSRQSTQDSDSDTIASTGEPIKKSDREYIIPIAVEGGGYVTPRAGSLEPNESSSSSVSRSRTKFGRARRLNTFFNDRDSEDESSPFSSLHRHGSIGRDSDNEDSKRDAFHMHRLRSTRPERSTLEHADSISSGEEDDDEGFEILTAENLFSTLLSRVRDLTQRLNVDDNIRPGFPSSRLLSRFDHGTDFWNRIEHPLTRHSSLGRTFSRDRPISNSSTGNSFGVPWRRSITRDIPSNIDNAFQNSNSVTGQRPPGDDTSNEENLNLADIDLKKLKLSEEDALALSYLTPSLSRRIQKQLLSQLPPSEIKKLHRTLSANTPEERGKDSKLSRRSVDRISSTLPRKFSVDNYRYLTKDETEKHHDIKTPKSFLPVKKDDYKPSYEFSLRSSSIGAEPRGDGKFLHYRPKIGKSVSLVEPKNYSVPKTDVQSSESSISESLSSSYKNNDSLDSSSRYLSDSSASRPCSKYSSDSYSRYVPSKTLESTSSITSVDSNKIKKAPPNTKRISRFLRPDFFEVPQEESVYLKEKKEREMETQKVLKEIRDKRKTRLNMRRERSGSREKQLERIKYSPSQSKESEIKESDNLIYTASNGIKNAEETVASIHDYENVLGISEISNTDKNEMHVKSELPELKTSTVLHDYVNVKASEKPIKPKKETVSRIARPKSYPAESGEKVQTIPEKESKMSKLRKGFTKQTKEKTKEEKNETNKIINEEDRAHKNKLLQTIEKKLEKFRSNNAEKGTGDSVMSQEKKSTVESVIKRLREQSLPRNLEHCTESGLIKRAVSVEDLSSSAPLQTSRKSVTKILGLFKKYEEHDNKQKPSKKTKSKLSSKNKISNKETVKDNGSEFVNDNCSANHNTADILNANVGITSTESSQSEEIGKKERPRSLLFDKVRKFQNSYNSTKSDTVLNNNNMKEVKAKSKLPVNSFRRSLNLDNLPETPKFYKNPSKNNINEPEKRADRRNLKLDFSKIPNKSDTLETEHIASANSGFESHSMENRNSLTTTDDSSTILSPSDDYMSCDSWSVCSDLHHINDLHSPISPNGNNLYSGDENESVIDRIRRKSFYTRFNEKKRPRRQSSFRDSDLNFKISGDYASLDRKSYEYRSPLNHRSSYGSLLQEPSKSYRPYTRSSSLVNDYVNVPNHYQSYNSKISRPNSTLYGNFEEIDTLDDLLTTAKSKKYSSHMQPSRLGRTSVSPVNEYFVDHSSSPVFSPTNSEPI